MEKDSSVQKKVSQKPVSKKKLINSFEWGLLVITLLICVVLVLHKNGIYIFNRTETSNFVENPKDVTTPMPSSEEEKLKRKERVDKILEDIARQFSEEDNTSKRQLLQSGLDDNQAIYYEQVKQTDKTTHTPEEWLGILKTSYATYQRVEQTLKGLGVEESVKQVAVEQIAKRLQKEFNIPANESMEYNKEKTPETLGEWASFVENYLNR